MLTLDDPAVSSRHAYLHLTARGLFAVDLATRSGTRVGPSGAPAGWLAPGDRLEVAGQAIEVVAIRRDAAPDDEGEPLAGDDAFPESPLDDAADAPLARLTLFPEDGPREPLSLNSALVFAGRSSACAVPVSSPSALRVQCVLVRDRHGAYVVDLAGRGTWRNDRPVRGAERILDGDALMLGSSRFQCRVEPSGPPRAAAPPAPSLGVGVPAVRAEPGAIEPARLAEFAPPLGLIPPEAQGAVLGWLMAQIQGRQDEANRRQSELQTDLVRLVAEIHRDNHAILQRHLERAEAVDRELATLREEIRRLVGGAPRAAGPQLSGPDPRATPPGPRPAPLRIAPAAPPEDPQAAAQYLIARANQLEQESRSNWKALLARLSGRRVD
jgi:pSer/pThr/pTyr-binding forkhead associated (FHA) protein